MTPMTPEEFDSACRAMLRRHPDMSCTSGGRSADRNKRVGGHPESKHLIDMARDFVGPPSVLREAVGSCKVLGLSYLLHDVGSGNHLHVQGLEPGPIPKWWADKYLQDP